MQLKLLNDDYELIGTTSHFGSVASGHYTAQCKDPIKARWWNNFNDSDSSEMTVDEIDKSGVYILFYQKVSNETKRNDPKAGKIQNNTAHRHSNRESKPSLKLREVKETKEGNKGKENKEIEKNDGTEEKEEESKYCVCNQPYDENKPMLACDDCDGWFHGSCIKYRCKDCSEKVESEDVKEIKEKCRKTDEDRKKIKEKLNKKIEVLQNKINETNEKSSDSKDEVVQLKELIKLKDNQLKELKDTNSKLGKENEKMVKEKTKMQESSEKKENKYKKDLDASNLKISKMEEKYTNLVKQMKTDHDTEIENLKKELHNKRREIDIHAKKINKMMENSNQEVATGKNTPKVSNQMQEDQSAQPEQEQEANLINAECEVNMEGANQSSMEEGVSTWKDKCKKKDSEIQKLKLEIIRFEARLESVLEESSVSEIGISMLKEETKAIKEVNKALECVMILEKFQTISKWRLNCKF